MRTNTNTLKTIYLKKIIVVQIQVMGELQPLLIEIQVRLF